MPKLSELFSIRYGHNYELSRLKRSTDGIAFVSRSSRNNGVSARVEHTGSQPSPAGCITVALGGSVLEAHLQPEPCYEGRDIAVLIAKQPMSEVEKLWYVECIRANKFRFNYNRQANRELPTIEVPTPPKFVEEIQPLDISDLRASKIEEDSTELCIETWSEFRVADLFDVQVGCRLTTYEASEIPGTIPFVAAAKRRNAVVAYTNALPPQFLGGVLTFIGNGQGGVGLCFYQPEPFIASRDIVVLTPRFVMDEPTGLLISTVLSEYRNIFNFGRKANAERVAGMKFRLPARGTVIDTGLVRQIVLQLPFTTVLADPQPSALEIFKASFNGHELSFGETNLTVETQSRGAGVPAAVLLNGNDGRRYTLRSNAIHQLIRGTVATSHITLVQPELEDL